MEDRLLALHCDGARLVGIAPTRRRIPLAVVEWLVCDEEGALHLRLVDATVCQEGERDSLRSGCGRTNRNAALRGCRGRRNVTLRGRRARASTQYRHRDNRGGANSNASACHPPSLTDGSCAVKKVAHARDYRGVHR